MVARSEILFVDEEYCFFFGMVGSWVGESTAANVGCRTWSLVSGITLRRVGRIKCGLEAGFGWRGPLVVRAFLAISWMNNEQRHNDEISG